MANETTEPSCGFSLNFRTDELATTICVCAFALLGVVYAFFGKHRTENAL
jgi:hypothetical protein